ncbi:cytochrome c-type biogenesis protein CcmE [Legionella geestiana]|uniref:Cytochrome c-type biogenesis protein CcmE n=1 Tax=Legionella geestiana TaxID=45065 RepID=A0A0W0UA65_9GAMM|nr:cytochrome c maturation protein CcmE [Legionella geestiana]KTD04851.1 cytochrome c-type biogenesis protein CcmE [Legionella geestiana]QBS11322.1 cytochrome c maturation protein CcmE [Legionella geestiana]STX54039.1 cytochrome c-type biogenesis protein CcmE [Legionella geestiana]
MKPVRSRKLWMILILVVLLSAVVGLVLYALRQNINLFYTPEQVARHELPLNQKVRLGGMVVKGSVERTPGTLMVRFTLTDGVYKVRVAYEGILPDLFREGQGIVAQGMLEADGLFKATEVLAKHDANYMPPEVRASLKKRGNA